MSIPSDRDRALRHPRPIVDIAAELGIRDDELSRTGRRKRRSRLEAITRLEAERERQVRRRHGHHADAEAEGARPTTTVGLAQGLNRIGRKASVNIRQPSLGPVFGIKAAPLVAAAPGHPDGGLQPPPDRRRPRDRRGP